jgi:hypothetical protein
VGLLALPAFLALIYRLQAIRRATLSGAVLRVPLLAYAYASIDVAIGTGRQRGFWCESDGQSANEYGQEGNQNTT